MTESVLDTEAILTRAKPLTHRQAPDTHPYGHLVSMLVWEFQ
jgi:hypothetical protein